MTLETKRLPRCGTLVLAKDGNGRTYCNRTQATKAAEKARAEGLDAHVWQPGFGPVFYVRIDEPEDNYDGPSDDELAGMAETIAHRRHREGEELRDAGRAR